VPNWRRSIHLTLEAESNWYACRTRDMAGTMQAKLAMPILIAVDPLSHSLFGSNSFWLAI
jgi:hypothetical protein